MGHLQDAVRAVPAALRIGNHNLRKCSPGDALGLRWARRVHQGSYWAVDAFSRRTWRYYYLFPQVLMY